ncbi:unnamed protein product [Urochloa humidicola]
MAGHVVQVPFPIGDAASFMGSIAALRQILANHLGDQQGDILDMHPGPNVAANQEHPVLPSYNGDQPARWLHINLSVAGGEEASSTTIFVRDDNMYCLGFRNQNGVCYQLTNPEGWTLPPQYNAVPLNWGTTYQTILNIGNDEEFVNILNFASLGRTFAVDAVHVLSHYQGVPDGIIPRLALAGLMIIVCESAKMNPVRNIFAQAWNAGTGLPMELVGHIGHWELISIALLDWRAHNYNWIVNQNLQEVIGINDPIQALDAIHLVRNFTAAESQLLLAVLNG